MDRIEKDQAIHKSSIVEELQLACKPVVRADVIRNFSHSSILHSPHPSSVIGGSGGAGSAQEHITRCQLEALQRAWSVVPEHEEGRRYLEGLKK